MSLLKRATYVIGGVALVVAFVGLLFGRAPAFESVPGSATRVTAGSGQVQGAMIQPYRARYATGTRALGIGLSRSTMDVEVSQTADGLQVVYDYAPDNPAVQDQMLLDRATLAPITRAFPGQTLTFRGAEMVVELRRPEGKMDTVFRTYGGNVFEVSVLDLVTVAAQPKDGDAFFIGWNNFVAENEWLAEVRVQGEETVTGPAGEAFATRIVDVRFPSGEVRRFWLASRPPYKIRQRRFEFGRLVQSGWDLVSFDVPPEP